MGCSDRSITFFKEHPPDSERSLSGRKGRSSAGETEHAEKSGVQNPKTKLKRSSNRDVDELSDVDRVVTSAKTPQFEAQLYSFEDDEAVIKMIIKGRSPTMRDVSRTHGVALDWFFDRINVDPKIQIKDVDTKNQLADMLTKDNFTRDEWDHRTSFVELMNFQMFPCSDFLSNRKQSVMSKRAQESTSYRGFGRGETDTDEFGVKEHPQRKENSSARFECFERCEESRFGSELCFTQRQETDAKQQPRPNNIFSRAATRRHYLPAPESWSEVMT